MNVFATYSCPVKSARALDDKRVNKMITETAQMLCTSLRFKGIDAPYKIAHPGHPCTEWIASDQLAFEWAVEHALELCHIYSGHRLREHAAESVVKWCSKWSSGYSSPPSKWVNCARRLDLGIDFTHVRNTHKAYRSYLVARWATDKLKPTWHERPLPDFLLKLD